MIGNTYKYTAVKYTYTIQMMYENQNLLVLCQTCDRYCRNHDTE